MIDLLSQACRCRLVFQGAMLEKKGQKSVLLYAKGGSLIMTIHTHIQTHTPSRHSSHNVECYVSHYVGNSTLGNRHKYWCFFISFPKEI